MSRFNFTETGVGHGSVSGTPFVQKPLIIFNLSLPITVGPPTHWCPVRIYLILIMSAGNDPGGDKVHADLNMAGPLPVPRGDQASVSSRRQAGVSPHVRGLLNDSSLPSG